MTTWATIVDRCENLLNDAGNSEWTTAELAEWINDAVRHYSQHFPLLKQQTINCGDSDHQYDLGADFMAIISVEYPDGEDPPEYLSRLPYTHADFWTGEKWYDILDHADDSDPAELIVSADTASGEDIIATYNGYHAIIANTASISGNTTVPEIHQELLIKYVVWQAALQLMFTEMQAPTSNSSLLMAQLSQNARRAESSYHTAVRQALFNADGVSRPVNWVSDSYSTKNSLGRIY
jgi:Family of unknown function (DUF6682)